MKTKIINLLGVMLMMSVIVSCNSTSASEDTQMLQKYYDVVYLMNAGRYVVIDSLDHVYDIRIGIDGGIKSTVKIR